jgi:hypothetical protein
MVYAYLYLIWKIRKFNEVTSDCVAIRLFGAGDDFEENVADWFAKMQVPI